MKKIAITFCCLAAFLFEGCKEVPPTIIFGASKAKDTTYVVSPAPAADPHNVLVEEFTGESCSNCPAAHTLLDNLVAAHPAGNINVISLYQDADGLSIPPDSASYDFRNDKAGVGTGISGSVIYTTNADANYSTLPGGGIDRVPLTPGTTLWLGSGTWTGLINTRLAVSDSINLGVTSVCSSGVATITATITYTEAVSTKQNLSIAIVEDSIIDFQEEPFGVINRTYVFNDVFVDMVTPVPFGDAILDTLATKEAGRVLKKVYTYTVPTAFKKGSVNAAHCRVIAFVHQPQSTSPDFHVIQSAQGKLLGP